PLEILVDLDSRSLLRMTQRDYEYWVDRLLHLGADIQHCNSHMPALAAGAGNYKIYKKIIPVLDDAHAATNCLRTMFSWIGRVRHTPDTKQIILDLIEQGANIHYHAGSLHHATYLFRPNHSPETFMLFLDMNIDPTVRNFFGKTCIEWQKDERRPDLLNTLHLHQALSNLYKQQYKNTLFGQIFMHACLECFKGHPTTVQRIICCKQASIRGKLDLFFKDQQLYTFLIPQILSRLLYFEQRKFKKELKKLYHFYDKEICTDCCAIS
nr:hypothetical protein [Candidatus Babeliales bacterium]